MINKALLAGVLLTAAAGAGAAAVATEDAVRRPAARLQEQIPGLRLSTDAPRLKADLEALKSGLTAYAGSVPPQAARADALKARISAIQAALDAAPRPHGAALCVDAANRTQAVLNELPGLTAPRRRPDFDEFVPAVQEAEAARKLNAGLEAAAERIRKRLAASGGDFDTARGVIAPPAAGRAPVPLPRPRDAARQAKPVYSAQTAAYQAALSVVSGKPPKKRLRADGLFGGATERAVRDFQEKHGLPVTGVLDRKTETALLSAYQTRRGLEITGVMDEETSRGLKSRRRGLPTGDYYRGADTDFLPTARQRTIPALTTVYTPYLAKTKKDKRMQGGTLDFFEQPVCTLERHVAGSCPYVSVAIDPRLQVPNGTPVLIPEISKLLGKDVKFRITDIGSPKYFSGEGHVDIATDSKQHDGYGSLISGREFKLVLPRGLR